MGTGRCFDRRKRRETRNNAGGIRKPGRMLPRRHTHHRGGDGKLALGVRNENRLQAGKPAGRLISLTAPSLPRIRALLGRGSPSRFALPQPRNADPGTQLEAPLRGHSSATRPGACPCALRATPLRPYGNCLRDPPPNKPVVQLPLRKSRLDSEGGGLEVEALAEVESIYRYAQGVTDIPTNG